MLLTETRAPRLKLQKALEQNRTEQNRTIRVESIRVHTDLCPLPELWVISEDLHRRLGVRVVRWLETQLLDTCRASNMEGSALIHGIGANVNDSIAINKGHQSPTNFLKEGSDDADEVAKGQVVVSDQAFHLRRTGGK